MPVSDITFSGLDFSGTPNDFDKRGATLIVEQENARRLTDVDENGDPLLPPLPYGTGAELKASYLGILLNTVNKAHASYVNQASTADQIVKELWKEATDAERQAALTALGG